MMFYLIGANGRLGQAIAREYAGQDIVPLDRSMYQAWSQPKKSDEVVRFFETRSCDGGATIFVASGLLDPTLPPDDLLGVNYHLPCNVIDAAAKLGARVFTFGTVMERLLTTKNAYVESKAMLGGHAAVAADAGVLVSHLQIHTLFGHGLPSAFMFLGQMLAALYEDRPFHMTSGRQLREYHHVDDEAKAIRTIEESMAVGILDVSHGRPVSLRDVAECVFRACGREHLLRVGSLDEPLDENYHRILAPNELLAREAFRDSLPAIAGYMRGCYIGGEGGHEGR